MISEAVVGKTTARSTTSRVPNAGRRIRFLFLPPQDAMSTAKTAGENKPPDAISAAAVVAAAEAVSALLACKSKSPFSGLFDFSASPVVDSPHEAV